MTKTCNKCEEEKALSEFYGPYNDKRLPHKEARYHASCKRCENARSTAWMKTHSYYSTDRIIIRKNKLKDELGGQCSWCSEADYRVLQFDHVENDGGQHRKALKRNTSVSDLRKYMREGGKIQLLCANCHVLKTYFGATSK